MTHNEKVERAIRELEAKGVHPYTTAPPLFRALWAAGVKIPPPFFMSFRQVFLLMTMSFGTLSGLFIWVVAEWWTIALPIEWLVLGAASAGSLFGLSMASYSRWKARRLGLLSWPEYGEA